jgi:hypothetical protein
MRLLLASGVCHGMPGRGYYHHLYPISAHYSLPGNSQFALAVCKNTPRLQCVAGNAARKAKRERERELPVGKIASLACLLSLYSSCDGDDDDDDKREPNEGRRTRRVVVVFCSRRQVGRTRFN